MNYIDIKTVYEVIAAISVNLTSGWIGAIAIFPGIFRGPADEFQRILTQNLFLAILGLIFSLILTQRGKNI